MRSKYEVLILSLQIPLSYRDTDAIKFLIIVKRILDALYINIFFFHEKVNLDAGLSSLILVLMKTFQIASKM